MKEFAAALRDIGCECDDVAVRKIFDAIDTSHSNTIEYGEFLAAFRVEDSHAGKGRVKNEGGEFVDDDWQTRVVQQVANALYQHRYQLRSAFRLFDTTNSGEVSAAEFEIALRALNRHMDNPLTDLQIQCLCSSLVMEGEEEDAAAAAAAGSMGGKKNGSIRSRGGGKGGKVNYRQFLEGFRIVDMGASRDGKGAYLDGEKEDAKMGGGGGGEPGKAGSKQR